MPEIAVRIAGAAGQGVQSLGEILARSIFRSGLFLHGELSFHSRIRGEENAFLRDKTIAAIGFLRGSGTLCQHPRAPADPGRCFDEHASVPSKPES